MEGYNVYKQYFFLELNSLQNSVIVLMLDTNVGKHSPGTILFKETQILCILLIQQKENQIK
jgi:hypothetical protein